MQQQGLASRHNPPKHFLPSNNGFVRGCEVGMGWGMHPTSLIQHQLDAGTLVELLPGSVNPVAARWRRVAHRVLRHARADGDEKRRRRVRRRFTGRKEGRKEGVAAASAVFRAEQTIVVFARLRKV